MTISSTNKLEPTDHHSHAARTARDIVEALHDTGASHGAIMETLSYALGFELAHTVSERTLMQISLNGVEHARAELWHDDAERLQ